MSCSRGTAMDSFAFMAPGFYPRPASARKRNLNKNGNPDKK